MSCSAERDTNVPALTVKELFLRFLYFGFNAWGGPVAQIALIKQKLVDEQGWISPQQFNRVLAVYQALPGPEAHELCCYFGYLAKGRLGAVIAGLGFMLPGFVLVLLAAVVYASFGRVPLLMAAFAGMQPAVAALIARAVAKLAKSALLSTALIASGLTAVLVQAAALPFYIALIAGGAAGSFAAKGRKALAAAVTIAVSLLSIGMLLLGRSSDQPAQFDAKAAVTTPSSAAVSLAGLKAGLLTFGGAYTSIPFLRETAVTGERWITNEQFIDAVAITSILPSPLIMFSTFVGYLAAGLSGAFWLTLAIFAPAFGFTLLGHRYFERMVENRSVHGFLDGITAAVVGIIAWTSLELVVVTVRDLQSSAVFTAALLIFLRGGSSIGVPLTMIFAAAVNVVTAF